MNKKRADYRISALKKLKTDTILKVNMQEFLNEVQLNSLVPSVFATGHSERVSDKYSFIPTIEVLRGLRTAGFHPVTAFQSRTRIQGKREFAKHVLRMRHENSPKANGLIPELVLVNSHDGTSSYQLRAGVFRIVCSNGMIVGDEIFCRRVHHKGNVVEKVVDAANDLIEIVPQSIQKCIDWQDIKLNNDEKRIFSEVASTLKWEKENVPVEPKSLLLPRRNEDKENDLWTTLNIVQENVMRGGIRYRTAEGQRQKTRAVNSVNENIRLNTALWSLAEKMSELKR